MLYFYIIILIVSSAALITDIILRYTEKIKNFDFSGRLFNIKNDIVPIEKFFPENLNMLIISSMTVGATGCLFKLTFLPDWLTLLCALACGLSTCFIVQYLGQSIVDFVKRNRLPKGEKAFGLEGVCIEPINTGDSGKVSFSHKNREFVVNAAPVNEEGINAEDDVVCVYESDEFYFVIKTNEIYNGIDTNF
ncbi:MAG: hypothetical protein FWF94_06845 [Oscillospiraceae bacterium]|nr:hypothetical protein [Oscillospiraceae bacterium]